MKVYVIQATVTTTGPEGSCTRQVPTFLLPAHLLGIVSEDHAQQIAREVINPTNADMTISLSVALHQ